ncbi:hypothetical protein QJQ45_029748, partial [Haematococcus lacustris]
GGADERVGYGWTVGRSPCGGEQPQIAQRGAKRWTHKLTKFNAGFNAVSGHIFAICPFEAHWWLYPVRSMAKRSRIRGLKCSTSNVIKRRFYDRDVSAALNIRRIAAGPPTRAAHASSASGWAAPPCLTQAEWARSGCNCATEACCGRGSGGTSGSNSDM